MATATLNGNAISKSVEETQELKPRRGNPFMKSLAPEMIVAPHPLEFADGMMSDSFALEKSYRTIIEPLQIKTQKDWLDYAKRVWQWGEDAELRRKQALADELLAKASEDKEVLEFLKKKLAA